SEHADANQHRVRDDADQNRQPQMLALQAHAQHMRVLRADGHDEGQTQYEAGRERSICGRTHENASTASPISFFSPASFSVASCTRTRRSPSSSNFSATTPLQRIRSPTCVIAEKRTLKLRSACCGIQFVSSRPSQAMDNMPCANTSGSLAARA